MAVVGHEVELRETERRDTRGTPGSKLFIEPPGILGLRGYHHHRYAKLVMEGGYQVCPGDIRYEGPVLTL